MRASSMGSNGSGSGASHGGVGLRVNTLAKRDRGGPTGVLSPATRSGGVLGGAPDSSVPSGLATLIWPVTDRDRTNPLCTAR